MVCSRYFLCGLLLVKIITWRIVFGKYSGNEWVTVNKEEWRGIVLWISQQNLISVSFQQHASKSDLMFGCVRACACVRLCVCARAHTRVCFHAACHICSFRRTSDFSRVCSGIRVVLPCGYGNLQPECSGAICFQMHCWKLAIFLVTFEFLDALLEAVVGSWLHLVPWPYKDQWACELLNFQASNTRYITEQTP